MGVDGDLWWWLESWMLNISNKLDFITLVFFYVVLVGPSENLWFPLEPHFSTFSFFHYKQYKPCVLECEHPILEKI